MMPILAVIKPDWRISSDELFERAGRLWSYSDDVYSAAKYPFVSMRVLKTAPNFGVILRHIAEAAEAEVEARYADEFNRLRIRRAELEAEIRSLGGNPDEILARRQATRTAPVLPTV